jgi:hypothetical protein
LALKAYRSLFNAHSSDALIHVSATSIQRSTNAGQQQQPLHPQPLGESGYGIVQVSSFLGSTKQNRMVKEALSADFADQVKPVTYDTFPPSPI